MLKQLRPFNTLTESHYILQNSTIEEISSVVEKFAESLEITKRDIISLRLSIEESLLNWQTEFGNGKEIILKYGNYFGRPRVIIGVFSEKSYNPFADDENSYSNSILVHMGLTPEYSYQKNWNTLTFSLKRKEKNQLFVLVVSVVFSIIFGILGRVIIPQSVLTSILKNFLSPVCDKFFDVLRCVSGPMIFLSVAWGLYGIGDAGTLSKIGKKMILKYISIVSLITVIVSPVYVLLGPAFTNSGISKNLQLGGVFEMILNIFPSNIFSPFIDGNTLQIIFIAMIVGIVMLFLGKKTSAVAVAIEQINYMVQFMVELISKLVPYFIFIVLVQMIWSDAYMIIADIWRFALIALPIFILNATVFLITLSIKYKVKLTKLFKKSLPTLLIALSTASSAASFGTIMECCSKRFGIDNKISSFGVPLGFVMFKPTTALYYLMISFYFAGVYQISCNVSWFIIAIFLSIVISMATPPIPGGSTAAYTMLFLQLGIPAEALSITLAVDILFDFFMTAGDMFIIPLCLLDFSAGTANLDFEVLRK